MEIACLDFSFGAVTKVKFFKFIAPGVKPKEPFKVAGVGWNNRYWVTGKEDVERFDKITAPLFLEFSPRLTNKQLRKRRHEFIIKYRLSRLDWNELVFDK